MKINKLALGLLLPLLAFLFSSCSGLQDLIGNGYGPYYPDLTSVIFADGKFMAVDPLNSRVVWISPDDATVLSTGAIDEEGLCEINFISFTNNKYIAGGSCNNYIYLSDDGRSWTALQVTTEPGEFDFGPNYIYDIIYGNNLYFAWGDASFSGYSEDLQYWRRLRDENGEIITQVTGLFYLNDQFIATSYYDALDGSPAISTVYLSKDGKTYTRYSLDSELALGSQMAFGNGVYVSANGDDFLLSGNFPRGLLTSTDATNWTLTFTSSDVRLFDIAYGNGRFVAVGGHVVIETDPDGYSIVTYDGGVVLSSTDGYTWTKYELNDCYLLKSVAFNGEIFMAVGLHGAIARSENGIDWSVREIELNWPE